MGRFGWHSGVVKVTSIEFVKAKPDYGFDMGQLTGVNKADARLLNNVAILTGNGAPTDGTSGTGANVAGPGSLYIDYTNANHYINANTKASPTWKLVTRAA
jgi:hypothetical protein